MIAETIKSAAMRAIRFSLHASYAEFVDGTTTQFPIGAQEARTVNLNGRVTYERYIYADGSRLEYRYDIDKAKYTFTVI